MNRGSYLFIVGLFAVSCTGDAGGGGVNIDETPEVTTTTIVTTTSVPPTTTTTVPTYQITGKVTRPDGTPVPRVDVTMGEQIAVTDSEGIFSFETTDPQTMMVSRVGWSKAEIPWDEAMTFFEVTVTQDTVRGLRVSPDAAANDAVFRQLLTLADQTAVNTLVFDTKQEGGKVLYDTAVADAHAIGAVSPLYDPATRVAQAHEAGLYAITRLVAFEDSHRSGAFPDERIASGWLDPTSATAREYNLALAREACQIGFDEVQFDYIRYPSGSTATTTGQLDMTQEQRVGNIASFLAEARSVLHPMGCAVSAAIFGIVASAENDQGLGQRPDELSAHLDAVSPMVYPSHYSPGWLGFEDPNAHPYDVTADALNDALPRMADGSQLRPWLQAFWWSNEQIRRSIQAAEDLGLGWILWNVRSNFDLEALPTDEEVATR